MNKEHTCCVTGHRDISAAKILYVQNNLRQELEQAIKNPWQLVVKLPIPVMK